MEGSALISNPASLLISFRYDRHCVAVLTDGVQVDSSWLQHSNHHHHHDDDGDNNNNNNNKMTFLRRVNCSAQCLVQNDRILPPLIIADISRHLTIADISRHLIIADISRHSWTCAITCCEDFIRVETSSFLFRCYTFSLWGKHGGHSSGFRRGILIVKDPNTERFKRTLIYFNTDTLYANFRGNLLCQATIRHLNNR